MEPCLRDGPLPRHQRPPHAGDRRDGGGRARHGVLMETLRHVLAVDPHAVLALLLHEVEGHALRKRGQRVLVVQGNAAPQGGPPHRAVHQAGVQEAET